MPTVPGAVHLLDLVFDPARACKGEARAARPPITYVNRLRVKHLLKSLPSEHSRVRRFFYGEPEDSPGLRRLAAGLIAATMALLAGLLAFR